jgi:hypothetical protein
MSHIDFNKIIEEARTKRLQERCDNDLVYKINNMINERTEKNRYMCFSVKCDTFAENRDGKILFAGIKTEYIFAKQNDFEGMIELQKYRENFSSASNITFEYRTPGSRVCGDGNISTYSNAFDERDIN